jgi:glutaredoxin
MRLILYVRRDCHLCTEMREELEQIREDLDITLELVDIDADPDLVRRYGHKVPVLVAGDYEICHYFLDRPQLLAFMEGRP